MTEAAIVAPSVLFTDVSELPQDPRLPSNPRSTASISS
ncbi:hypothetical protein RHIZO_05303 [Rhizobiaceae bacterium]|nr:hypothetical protein RHIZO_05303 [Rhizobiaceae bacterium]